MTATQKESQDVLFGIPSLKRNIYKRHSLLYVRSQPCQTSVRSPLNHFGQIFPLIPVEYPENPRSPVSSFRLRPDADAKTGRIERPQGSQHRLESFLTS